MPQMRPTEGTEQTQLYRLSSRRGFVLLHKSEGKFLEAAWIQFSHSLLDFDSDITFTHFSCFRLFWKATFLMGRFCPCDSLVVP